MTAVTPEVCDCSAMTYEAPRRWGRYWSVHAGGCFWEGVSTLIRRRTEDTRNGVASPASGPVEAFGQSIEPGEPAIDLDPSHVYRVQVWARGREDSRERHEEAMQRGAWGASEGFEEYAVVFTSAGEQEAPVPSGEVGLRERFARQRAEEDEIARLLGHE
ncbi:hypothetical protein [Streptomyces sp. NPDC058424]|uniref:hypothetical protein n=2 Tax=unclassified Streptomyces TaxID=2593676 RepID=UPI003653D24D